MKNTDENYSLCWKNFMKSDKEKARTNQISIWKELRWDTKWSITERKPNNFKLKINNRLIFATMERWNKIFSWSYLKNSKNIVEISWKDPPAGTFTELKHGMDVDRQRRKNFTEIKNIISEKQCLTQVANFWNNIATVDGSRTGDRKTQKTEQ